MISDYIQIPYFEKNNFITKELCKELIDIVNSNKYEFNSININTSRVKKQYISYKIYDEILNKYIKNILQYEVLSYLKNHRNNSDTKFYFENYFEILKFENDSHFSSYDYDYDNYEKNNKIYYSIIKYYVFLNDNFDNGEIEILNSYIIKPKTGKGIIAESGWCFPYKQNISLNFSKYILTGFVYEYI